MNRLDGNEKKFRVLTCPACRVVFQATGPRAKFCSDCSLFRQRATAKLDAVRKRTGAGSGGQNMGSATIHNYRYRYLTKLYIKQRGLCTGCHNSFPESTLLVHHKDENRHNNDETNLELMCKRCHQIEHECWLAFSKVQRLSERSRAKRLEAHSPE